MIETPICIRDAYHVLVVAPGSLQEFSTSHAFLLVDVVLPPCFTSMAFWKFTWQQATRHVMILQSVIRTQNGTQGSDQLNQNEPERMDMICEILIMPAHAD
jgi:hypothetical protein